MKKLIVAVTLALSLAFSGPVLAQSSAGSSADSYAAQQQVQGQSQGQTAISGGGSVSNSGNSQLRIQGSFNGSKPVRFLPVPAVYPMENYQAMPYQENFKEKGFNFVSMHHLIEAMNYVDLDAPVDMKDIKVNIQLLQKLPPGHPPVSRKAVAASKAKGAVKFSLAGDGAVNGGFKPTAVITMKVKDADDLNSAALALTAGKWARHMKAERVVFLAEGAESQLQSYGWGIGMSYSGAKVGSDGNDQGQVGAGGFGYSRGYGGFKRFVYLTALVGNGGDE